MKRNSKGFGCIVIVISMFVAIAVTFSKLRSKKSRDEIKGKLIKKIKIK
ncbi:MAG: hypothetical protein ABI721_05710 [Candidatus Dojkabacteria bacterium]